jgi:hypothetical protein
MRTPLLTAAAVIAAGPVMAQPPERADLSYSYAELRFVDADDNDGDGLRLNGSFALDDNWLVVGGLTEIDYDRGVDATTLEVGAGYVWHYREEFDLVGTLRYVDLEVDLPGGSADDTGFALAAGARGWLAPQFEWRGFVHHVNLDDSDTFLELAGDYYLTEEISVGLSLEFAGDNDIVTIGGRWFFR